MNKRDAGKIAETITLDQLRTMFNNAKDNITDWQVVSSVNKNMTKGAAWNILTLPVDVTPERVSKLAMRNMVWEFGDFLPEDVKIKRKSKKKQKSVPYHEDPIF